MTNNRKVAQADLPLPSTEVDNVNYVDEGGDALLRLEFERDKTQVRLGILFDSVRAYRFRAESHCTEWHVDGVYDTLAEVVDSDWVAELRAAQPEHMHHMFEIHHFMIYLDSSGCYEVAAASWKWLDEEPIE
jgi:hypothetical protein